MLFIKLYTRMKACHKDAVYQIYSYNHNVECKLNQSKLLKV